MATHDANRRRMLHQLLISGCALGASALFAACNKAGNESQQAIPLQPAEEKNPQPLASDSSANFTTANSETIESSTKVSKQAASYQEQPKGNNSCANCLHFMPDSGTCALVEGQISPDGWCVLWVEKA